MILPRITLILCSIINICWAESIQEIEVKMYRDYNNELNCKINAPELVNNEKFRVYVNMPNNENLLLYRVSCSISTDGGRFGPVKKEVITEDFTQEANCTRYVTTMDTSWRLPDNRVDCKLYTHPCDPNNTKYCRYEPFKYDSGVKCHSKVYVVPPEYINNIIEVEAMTFRDQPDDKFQCRGNVPELAVNAPFRVHLNVPDNEDLKIYGGRCYKSNPNTTPIVRPFWRKPRDSKPGFVSSVMPPLNRTYMENFYCQVYTKTCIADSHYTCFYKGYNFVVEGITCNLTIHAVKPADKDSSKFMVTIVAVACVTITVLIVAAAVWTRLHLSKRKRNLQHAISSDIEYRNLSNNEGSMPVSSASGNSEAYSNQKHVRKPTVDLAQNRGPKTGEPTYANVQDSQTEPTDADIEKDNKNQNQNTQNSDLTYAVLYHSGFIDSRVPSSSESPYVQVKIDDINKQNYVNVEELKPRFVCGNSTYVNEPNIKYRSLE